MSNYLMQYFSWSHLPIELQTVSKEVAELAQRMNDILPSNPEKTVGLRKLMEAKDCFVRAQLAGEMPRNPS